MPSKSLARWNTERAAQLDEVEAAHRSVGGAGPGRRFATQQINNAYAVLVASQFQGFCRDLHTEARAYILAAVTDSTLREGLRALMADRKIDRGNPSRGNLGADFNRFGPGFWDAVYAEDSRNRTRAGGLDELVDWRNAVAHQDYVPVGGDPRLPLRRVQAWRRACAALARGMDCVVGRRLAVMVGHAPW